MFRRLACLALLATLAVACAPVTKPARFDSSLVASEAEKQREIALRSMAGFEQKLQAAAFPLLTGAASLCGEHTAPTLGLRFANAAAFPAEFRRAAATVHGVDETIRVLGVAPRSPAETAGLKPGDQITAINQIPAPRGDKAVERCAELLEQAMAGNKTVTLSLLRNGKQQTLTVKPATACAFPVLLSEADEINAYADGEHVIITMGMMRFIEKPQELSLVIAHELAHCAMEHSLKQTGNYMVGSLFDIAVAVATGIDTGGLFGEAAAQVYSQEFEQEADYVGLYMMANAKLDIEGAANFWRRLAAAHPGGIEQSAMSSHPSTPERFVGIESTVAEIRQKRTKGLPLTPTRQAE